ncbi:MAG: hypothetical protein O3A47_10385 [Chloroflexi bacterium]|nr:hypothetical protein [Chloroflexota bacterium]
MSKSVMNARRSAIDIVHDILKVCDKGSINKTAIMYQSNLSRYFPDGIQSLHNHALLR